MSYRNKTYVCFDADTDMHYYRLMQAWKSNENIDFNFYNAHELNTVKDGDSEENIKKKLRERLANTKQMVVLIGEKTKYLYKFVRWEMDVALEKDIPIIAVNLNGTRKYDKDRCPAIISETYTVHVSFNKDIIKYALDNFPGEYAKREKDAKGPRHYGAAIYKQLGLE